MDIKRFELTDEVICLKCAYKNDCTWEIPSEGCEEYESYQPLLEAQIAKVLSMLEPVELEALGYTQKQAREDADFNEMHSITYALGYRTGSRSTIQHNQSKGQLYRIREG